MAKLRLGIVRYASVANAIAQQLQLTTVPQCTIGAGRISITFRNIGASGWADEARLQHAVGAAAIARSHLSTDSRADVRARSTRAIVVAYDEATTVAGIAVTHRSEYVVPVPNRVT